MSSTKRKFKLEADYAIAPGESLAEIIEAMGMSQKELAKRTGLTEQSIHRIIYNAQPISLDTANSLELTLGTPAAFWISLESNYRQQLYKIEEQEKLKQQVQWLKKIPISELTQSGVIQKKENKADQVRETLRFYGLASVEAWESYWADQPVAARCSQSAKTKAGPTSAWIRSGEIMAHSIRCEAFNKELFLESLSKIRKLTREDFTKIQPQMINLCAKSGVAVSFVHELKGAPWYGAAKWLSSSKAMILLSIRGKRDDQFWFSFFHEAAHILKHSKKDLFLSNHSKADPREQEADEWAAEFLIPQKHNEKIAHLRTKKAVTDLAASLKIAPGIVVGRYQHLTGKYNYFNDLKAKLSWVE